jgi:hypothetical protein
VAVADRRRADGERAVEALLRGAKVVLRHVNAAERRQRRHQANVVAAKVGLLDRERLEAVLERLDVVAARRLELRHVLERLADARVLRAVELAANAQRLAEALVGQIELVRVDVEHAEPVEHARHVVVDVAALAPIRLQRLLQQRLRLLEARLQQAHLRDLVVDLGALHRHRADVVPLARRLEHRHRRLVAGARREEVGHQIVEVARRDAERGVVRHRRRRARQLVRVDGDRRVARVLLDHAPVVRQLDHVVARQLDKHLHVGERVAQALELARVLELPRQLGELARRHVLAGARRSRPAACAAACARSSVRTKRLCTAARMSSLPKRTRPPMCSSSSSSASATGCQARASKPSAASIGSSSLSTCTPLRAAQIDRGERAHDVLAVGLLLAAAAAAALPPPPP